MAADLIVIGGGIMGMMAAYKALKTKPDASVIQLEQSMICSGATRFCAAFAPVYGCNPEVLKMAIQSREAYMRIKNVVPEMPIYELPSYWITQESNLNSLSEKLYKPCTKLAMDEDWTSESLKACGIEQHPDNAMLCHHIGHYSLPTQFSFHMLNQLNSHKNYQLHQSLQVVKLSMTDDIYQVHTSDGQVHESKRVLVAIGPWFTRAAFMKPWHDLNIRVKKVLAFHIHRQPPQGARTIFFPDHDAFLLPIAQSKIWIFSYTCDQWDVLPDVNSLHVEPDNRQKALEVLQKMAPALIPHCSGGHAFCDTYSQNKIPLVERGLLGDNMVIITGANGAGFRLAPALAAHAIEKFSIGL